MKRLALAATLVLGLAACGSGGGSTTVALHNPLETGMSLQVSGSKEAAPAVSRELEQLTNGALVPEQTADVAKSTQECKQTIPIVTYPVTTSSLRGLDGQKVTVTIYGHGQLSAATCQQLPDEFPDGIPVIGGNRRIYHQPSSAMEPTLHCARAAGQGCLGRAADALVTALTGAKGVQRHAIVVFNTPKAAASACGEGGTFVKRIIGLPGETVKEDNHGFIWIRGPSSQTFVKLNEPYISARAHHLDTGHFNQQWNVPAGAYFVMGDNRGESCDSRQWGSVPAANVIGPVAQIIRDGKALKPAGIPG